MFIKTPDDKLMTFQGAACFGAPASSRGCTLMKIIPPMPNPELLTQEIQTAFTKPIRERIHFTKTSQSKFMEMLKGYCQQGLPLPNVFEDPSVKFEGFSEFRLAVYQDACAIPCGETRPYSWLSKQLRKYPQYKNLRRTPAQAVGQSMKTNPFPLIIPCHRVVQKNGGLGGYMGEDATTSLQVGLKKALLDLEGMYRQPDLFHQATHSTDPASNQTVCSPKFLHLVA